MRIIGDDTGFEIVDDDEDEVAPVATKEAHNHFDSSMGHFRNSGSQQSLARYSREEYTANKGKAENRIGPCLACDAEPVFKMYYSTIEAECSQCGETLAWRRIDNWGRWIFPTVRMDLVPALTAEEEAAFEVARTKRRAKAEVQKAKREADKLAKAENVTLM